MGGYDPMTRDNNRNGVGAACPAYSPCATPQVLRHFTIAARQSRRNTAQNIPHSELERRPNRLQRQRKLVLRITEIGLQLPNRLPCDALGRGMRYSIICQEIDRGDKFIVDADTQHDTGPGCCQYRCVVMSLLLSYRRR